MPIAPKRNSNTMRICIPTKDDRGLESGVSGHFGRAPFYAVVETETGEVAMESNAKNCHGDGHGHGGHHHHGHGHGGGHRCGCHQIMDSKALGAVFCKGMGRGALAGFSSRGIDVYLTSKETVGEILEEFRGGGMKPFGADLACAGHHH
jgi:predicted Fe-Mo cluster-binding NifX family protein